MADWEHWCLVFVLVILVEEISTGLMVKWFIGRIALGHSLLEGHIRFVKCAWSVKGTGKFRCSGIRISPELWGAWNPAFRFIDVNGWCQELHCARLCAWLSFHGGVCISSSIQYEMITRYAWAREAYIEITQASSSVKIPRSLPCDKISVIISSTKGGDRSFKDSSFKCLCRRLAFQELRNP